MATEYVINNELTPNATLTPDLIKRCTFTIGPNIPVKTSRDTTQKKDETSSQSRQYHQKFVEVSYPDGSKSSSMIIPEVVIHHEVFDYYGKSTVHIGVPQWFVKAMELKFSESNEKPLFQDRKIQSDAKYWWTKGSFVEAAEHKEYIRTYGDDGVDEYYGSFADFFATFPTSVLSNVTCSLKLGTDTALNTVPVGTETWRCGLAISMVTPYDGIEISAPSTGIGAKSMLGNKDKMRKGLMSKKVSMN